MKFSNQKNLRKVVLDIIESKQNFHILMIIQEKSFEYCCHQIL